MTDKPNVLFLLADDMSIRMISALGNRNIRTPALDDLSSEGTYFDNACIPGGYTGAVCMPSRAMLHSGKYLTSLKNSGADISGNGTLLGELFRQNGYMTFGCGKWHNGPKAFTESFEDGDNIFFGGMWDHWNVPVNSYDPLGNYDNVVPFVVSFPKSNKIRKVHCDRINPGFHSSELIADTACRFIRNYKGKRPFFCYTAFLAPHDPRTMPDEFRKMYEKADIPLPANFSSHYPLPYSDRDMRDEALIPYPRTEEAVRNEIRDYYAMISHLDSCIGRIISTLKEKGVYDDTIIVFASDNGLSMGSHAFLGKQNVYEEALRVPLLFSGPGIQKDKRVTERIYLHDTYPTLCDLLGFTVPVSCEGISYAPLLGYGHYSGRREFYHLITDRARAIVRDNMKLSVYYEKNSMQCALTLHDLEHDPFEMNDLHTTHPELTRTMFNRLKELRDELHDSTEPEAITFWNGISDEM
ncbi:MAG: sulfatase-like hydrolase/transferase [Bullifex sp.]